MNSTLSAEALKLSRHRAAWFLVWIYPIGVIALVLIGMAFDLAETGGPRAPQSAESWIDETAYIWAVPTTGFGRYLITAFVAVAIAGEYSWNTWKLIVPHRPRWMLLAAKLAVIVGFLYFAFLLAALLTVGLAWAWDVVSSDPIPAGVDVGSIFRAHALGFANSLPPFFYTLAYASLAAILTRSMLATLVIAIFVGMEGAFTLFAPGLYNYAPGLVWALLHLLPGYHLQNLETWITTGQGLSLPLAPGLPFSLGWAASGAAIGAWIVGLVALAFASFQRQDIN